VSLLQTARARTQEIVVATGLLVPDRLPDVSAASGERPARPVLVEARSKPWWPWLLLLTGFVGVVILAAFYPRMCERREVWIPLADADLRRAAEHVRHAWWTGGPGVVLMVGAIGWLLVGSAQAGSGPVVVLAIGAVLLLSALAGASRAARPVRLTLRPGGRQVVLHDVHPGFVAEVERRWS
jgi:hypothetical protein